MSNKVSLIKACDIQLPKTDYNEMNALRQAALEFHIEAHELADTIRRLKKDSAVLNGVCSILNDAIVRITSKGKILDLNPSAEKLFSIEKRLCVGRDLAYLCGVSFEDFKKELSPTGRAQLKIFSMSGYLFDASVSVTEITHDQESEFIFVIRDISDIIRMKSALIDSDTKFEVLSKALDEATDVIIITDKDNKIIFANKAFTQHTGYSYKECIGKNPGFYRSGKTHDEVYTDMWNTVRQGKVWQGVFLNESSDNKILVDDTLIIPVTQRNSVLPMFYIAVRKVGSP